MLIRHSSEEEKSLLVGVLVLGEEISFNSKKQIQDKQQKQTQFARQAVAKMKKQLK
jgi:hypothetical protein